MLWWICPLRAEAQKDKHPTNDEVQRILTEEEDEKIEVVLPFLDGKATLGILAEFIASYVDISDESDKHSDNRWDLYLDSLELDLEIVFTTWLKADIVAEIENVGKKDDTATLSSSKAFATIRHPGFPLYFIGGKRTQPFGLFEDRMISGTITEDLYEIDETGATIGVTPDRYPMDLSFTVYEGQDIIANLEDFGPHEFNDGRKKEDGIDSYIANLTLTPLDDMFELAIFYSSEPGDGNRNESIGGSLSVYFWDFIVDAEYITALKRECGENGDENKENAWFLGLAFRPVQSLELATRIEFFDDDHTGKQDEVIEHRYLAGLNYWLTDHIALSVEYRYSRYERETDSAATDHKNEIQFQFAIAY